MDEKINIIRNRLGKYKKAALAFSGGIDSTFLDLLPSDIFGESLLLITATSKAFPFYELEEAKSIARRMKLRHKVFLAEDIDIDSHSAIQPYKCLYCSSDLFRKIKIRCRN